MCASIAPATVVKTAVSAAKSKAAPPTTSVLPVTPANAVTSVAAKASTNSVVLEPRCESVRYSWAFGR